MLKETFLTVLTLILAAASAVAVPSARLKAIEFKDGVVLVKLDTPTTWRTTPWRSANRYIVDIAAVGADPKQQELVVVSPRLKGVRWTQFKPDTVRVVLDLTGAHVPVVVAKPPSDVIEIRVTPSAPAPAGENPVPPTLPAPPESVATKETDSPPRSTVLARVGAISVERDEDGRPARILIRTDRPVVTSPEWRENHLVIALPDTEAGPEQVVPVNDDLCIRVRTSREGGQAVVIVDFTQPVTYALAPLEEGAGFAVTLDFDTPAAQPEPLPSLKSLTGKVIVIDAGHGGRDTGTRGPFVKEKNVNLDVALRMQRLLTSQGVRVILTREDDTLIALRRRPRIAMEANADAFVSLHCNYAPANYRGAEVWHRRDNAESRRLATCLYRAHLSATGFYGRGVKPESHAPGGGFAVLKHNTVPCALVEFGFVNNSVEGKAMATPEWRQKVAEGLTAGLARFMEGLL